MNFLKTSLMSSVAHAAETGSGSGASAFVQDPAVVKTMNDMRADVEPAQYAQLREVYKTMFKTDCPLNNEQLLYVIASSPDDKSPEAWAKLVKEHETALTGGDETETDADDDEVSVSITGRDANAIAVGTKLANDEAFKTLLSSTIDKKIEAETGAIPIMIAMEGVLGTDAMRAMPFPNSTDDDVKATNLPADCYTVKVIENGKRKKINGRWSWDVADTMPNAQEWIARLEQAKKDGPKGTKKIGPSEYQDIAGFCRKKINYNRQYVQNAISCWLNLDTINGMTGLEAFFRTKEDDKTPAQHPEPFVVQSTKAKERDFTASMTVTQFKSLRPHTAIANGGGYGDLIDTMNRAGSAGSSGEEDAIEGFKDFEGRVLPVVNYLETKGLDEVSLWLKRNPANRIDILLVLQSIEDSAGVLTGPYMAEIVARRAKDKAKTVATTAAAEPAKKVA